MAKYRVMVARFPGDGTERYECSTWIMQTLKKLWCDSQISAVDMFGKPDTPISMLRNKAVKTALCLECDYILMIDNDMHPDRMLEEREPGARPFWDSSWEWMLAHRDRPGAIAAPYCGRSGVDNVFVFRWRTLGHREPQVDHRLEQFSREEAAERTGIEEVAALPTGVILYDMRVFKELPKPWFDYEWKDEEQTEKVTTEDVFETRNQSLLGFPCWVNWDAWAGHKRSGFTGKPKVLPVEAVRERMREAMLRGFHVDERVMMLPSLPNGDLVPVEIT